jgi:hypothetical protein
MARLLRETIPEQHHDRCDSRYGGECDCYMRRYADELAAIAAWEKQR